MKKTTNKAKGVGVCLAAIVFLLFAAGSASESGTTSSKQSKDSSEPAAETSVTSKDSATNYVYDTEKIIREGHPMLLDSIDFASSFWKEDQKANAVVIRDGDEREYPYAYLLLDCGQINNDATEKVIQTIRTSFYNCKDAQLFRLKDGIEIVRSYLPTEIMKENYELRSSEYQNIWINDWESDGTKKPNFQYDYYTNYELISDNQKDLPEWISIHVYLDGWGLVQDALICTEEYKDEVQEPQEWNYDYIANNDSFSSGEPCWDLAVQIQYTRPSGTPALRKGDKGYEVGWLQTALNKVMNAYLSVDCSFGAGTEEKVKEFQSRCGLGADGVVGSQTIEMLVDILSGNKKMPEKIVVTDPPRAIIVPEPEPEQPASVYTPPTKQSSTGQYVLNTSTMKIHTTTCRDLSKMDPENRTDYTGSIDDLLAQGYTTCGHCHPH